MKTNRAKAGRKTVRWDHSKWLLEKLVALRMLRPLKTVVVFAAILFFLSSCGGKDKQKDTRQLLTKLPFSNVTDSIERFPNDASLYARRGRLLAQRGYPDLATSDFETAWKLSKDPGAALDYISNLLIVGDISSAMKLLREQSVANPENPEFNRRLAEVYQQQGKPDSAMKQLDIVIEKDPDDFEAHYERGAMLAQMKDTAGAIHSLERSFAILPINYSGLALANIYAQRKNPRALVICDELLRRDSTHVQTDPIYVKGVYYSEKKQYDSAVSQFDLCIQRDWKMTDAYIEKGIIFFEKKDVDSAMNIFRMAATVSNTDADAYFWMARCYEAKGEKQEAAENYDRAIALDRGFDEAREGLKRVTR